MVHARVYKVYKVRGYKVYARGYKIHANVCKVYIGGCKVYVRVYSVGDTS